MRRALEVISFQNRDFFEELIGFIEGLKSIKGIHRLSNKEFFSQKTLGGLSGIIKKYTNLNVEIVNGARTGFATDMLFMDANHVFLRQKYFDIIKKIDPKFDPQSSIKTVMTELKKSVVSGSVDMKTGKVGGVYTQIPCVLYAPKDLMIGTYLSSQECAAIILHEVGHNFNMLEMVGRTVTTNLVLSGLSKYLDKSLSEEDRHAVFATASKELDYSQEITAKLKQCRTDKQLTTVLLDAAIVQSKSELGMNIYDLVSCEQMADQYATRMGAGKELVTGLGKIISLYGRDANGVFWVQVKVYLSMLAIVLASFGVLLIPLVLLLIYGPSKEGRIYDSPQIRFRRIKEDQIAQLKDPDVDADVAKNAVVIIKGIDEVLDSKQFDYDLLWAEKIAYYLNSEFRSIHKFEMLQRDLEQISNNDLFTRYNELKTL